MLSIRNSTLSFLVALLFVGVSVLVFPRTGHLHASSDLSNNSAPLLEVNTTSSSSFVMRTTIEQELLFTQANEEKKLFENCTIDLLYTPIPVENNDALKMVVKCIGVRANIFDIHNGLASFNSDQESMSPISPLVIPFTELMNETMTLIIHRNGSVEEQNDASSPLAEFVGSPLVLFPETPVRKGCSWSGSHTSTDTSPRLLNTSWECLDLNEEKITLSLKSTICGNPLATQAKLDGLEMSPDMSGSEEGKLTIDGKSGLVVAGKINQKIRKTIFSTDGSSSQPITLDIKSKIEYKKL